MTDTNFLCIKRISAWLNKMPLLGDDYTEDTSSKILVSIKLNQRIENKITKITLENLQTKENWNVNLEKINTYEYEIRENEIVIRNGPSWNNCDISVKIEFEKFDNSTTTLLGRASLQTVY